MKLKLTTPTGWMNHKAIPWVVCSLLAMLAFALRDLVIKVEPLWLPMTVRLAHPEAWLLAFLAGGMLLALIGTRALLPGLTATAIGPSMWKGLVAGSFAIAALYLVTWVLALGVGIPREPSMTTLFLFRTDSQIVVKVLALLVLPPIYEEILFRYFLLGAVPYGDNLKLQALATLLASAVFVSMHSYEYWTTNLLIFMVGILTAAARIHSRGLLVPIAMHMQAVAWGLLLNAVWAAYLE